MMTWKSYAAASGATVLAGWLASAPPVGVSDTSRPAPPVRSPRVVPSASTDIVEQASRLQARIRRETAYVRPRRNPFQFEAHVAPSAGVAETPEALTATADVPAPVVPSAPAVTLAGIAEDQIQQGVVERTAILSSPSGVLVVRVGDDVLGQYRVGAVEGDSVDLVSLADGSTLRLALAGSPPR